MAGWACDYSGACMPESLRVKSILIPCVANQFTLTVAIEMEERVLFVCRPRLYACVQLEAVQSERQHGCMQ